MRGGVYYNRVAIGLLNFFYDNAFVIALKKLKLYFGKAACKEIINIFKSVFAVKFGLSFAQHIQISAVYNQYIHKPIITLLAIKSNN